MFVTGWTAIGAVYGVTGKQARAWYGMGAPILCLGGGKPVAEVQGLWEWLLDNRAEVEEGGAVVSAAHGKAIVGEEGERALVAAVLARR